MSDAPQNVPVKPSKDDTLVADPSAFTTTLAPAPSTATAAPAEQPPAPLIDPAHATVEANPVLRIHVPLDAPLATHDEIHTEKLVLGGFDMEDEFHHLSGRVGAVETALKEHLEQELAHIRGLEARVEGTVERIAPFTKSWTHLAREWAIATALVLLTLLVAGLAMQALRPLFH